MADLFDCPKSFSDGAEHVFTVAGTCTFCGFDPVKELESCQDCVRNLEAEMAVMSDE